METDDLVAAFLAAGGTIKKIPTGQSSIKNGWRKYSWDKISGSPDAPKCPDVRERRFVAGFERGVEAAAEYQENSYQFISQNVG